MKRTIQTLIGTTAALMTLCISSSASAFTAIDERFPDHRIIITAISPGDNYLDLQNNNMNADTPSLRAVSVLSSSEEADTAELVRQGAWQPAGMTPVAFLIAPEDSPIRTAGGTLRLDAAAGLDLSSSTGLLYYIVNQVNMATHEEVFTAYEVNYKECLQTAAGNLSGLECRAATKDGRVIYEAYRDGERLAPQITLQNDTSAEQQMGLSHDASVNQTESQDSRNIATGSAKPQNPAHVNRDIKKVENTKTDTKSTTASTAVAAEGSILPPSSPGSAKPMSESMATTLRTTDYAWWALIPILLVSLVLFWLFFILPKRKTREPEEEYANR